MDAVRNYDRVIRAVEFSLNLSGSLVADYDSVKVGMISLCCDKLISLVGKLPENFSMERRKVFLQDIEDIRGRLLSVKVRKRLLVALDEIMFRIRREGGIPCLSFFREVDRVIDHVFLDVPCGSDFGTKFVEVSVHDLASKIIPCSCVDSSRVYAFFPRKKEKEFD